MKRILAILLCVGIFAAVAAGCGGAQKEKIATGDEAASLNAADYKDNLEGLCNYLAAWGYINPYNNPDEKKSNEGVTYSKMRGELIGAKADSGKRFTAQHRKDTTIELYEYDLGNLNATADEVRASVEKDGTFKNLIGETVNNVYISNNKKYLMIYTDTTINGDTKETDDNYKSRQEVVEKFKKFHEK